MFSNQKDIVISSSFFQIIHSSDSIKYINLTNTEISFTNGIKLPPYTTVETKSNYKIKDKRKTIKYE